MHHARPGIRSSLLLGSFLMAASPASAMPTGMTSTEVGGVEGEAETKGETVLEPSAMVSVVSELSGDGAAVDLSQLEAALAFERGWLGAEGVLSVSADGVALGFMAAELRIVGPHHAMRDADVALTLFGGKIDAPIGFDADQYQDLQRPMISAPLLLEATHDEWNDWGAGVRLGVDDLEVTVFGARAYAPAAAEATEVGTDLATEAEAATAGAWTPGPAFGARGRYALTNWAAVATSGAAIFDTELTLRAGLAEADVEVELAQVKLRAEGLVQLTMDAGPVFGAYVTAQRTFGWFEAAARAELVVRGAEVEPRLGVTAGAAVWPEHLLVRAEYDTDLSRLEDRVQLQVVAAL